MLVKGLNQEELCEGCVSCIHEEDHATCYLLSVYKGKFVSKVFKYGDLTIIRNCPCVSCIVKVICTRFCNIYQAYTHQW